MPHPDAVTVRVPPAGRPQPLHTTTARRGHTATGVDPDIVAVADVDADPAPDEPRRPGVTDTGRHRVTAATRARSRRRAVPAPPRFRFDAGTRQWAAAALVLVVVAGLLSLGTPVLAFWTAAGACAVFAASLAVENLLNARGRK